ncbi:hypothetical protein, partial [Acinetobacter baumannii]|uniref:hypothetical protein n=1 Tax=Acinetobacter baumannii TaxID=470 RepID=UPI001C0A50D1
REPLAQSCRAERGQARSVPRGDEAARGIQPQSASTGPAWGGPALGPKPHVSLMPRPQLALNLFWRTFAWLALLLLGAVLA